MTRWGKFLRFIGMVADDELEWMLYRIKQFRHGNRNWSARVAKDLEDSVFADGNDALCVDLLERYQSTRLARIHGWTLRAGTDGIDTPFIHIQLISGHVDVTCAFKMWVYDIPYFLEACNGKLGMDLADLNWALSELTRVAVERKSKQI